MKYAFLEHMPSYIHRVYSYYSYAIYNQLSIYSYHIPIRGHPHIIHVIHSIHIKLCTIFCWLFFLKLCYCVLLLEKVILIGSVECPSCCLELHGRTFCIMNTLGTSVLIIKVFWLSRSVHMLKHLLWPQLSVWIM